MMLYICDLCEDYNRYKMIVFKPEDLEKPISGFGNTITASYFKNLHICHNCLQTKFNNVSEEGGQRAYVSEQTRSANAIERLVNAKKPPTNSKSPFETC